MRIYTVNENHIGSAVSEILQYKQTDRQTYCYFYIIIYLWFWRRHIVAYNGGVYRLQLWIADDRLMLYSGVVNCWWGYTGVDNIVLGLLVI